nr:hypothetical protein [Tanacetum cinerariifolium]
FMYMKLLLVFAAAGLLGTASAQAQTVLPSGAVAPAGAVVPTTGAPITPGTVPGAQPVEPPTRGSCFRFRAAAKATREYSFRPLPLVRPGASLAQRNSCCCFWEATPPGAKTARRAQLPWLAVARQ